MAHRKKNTQNSAKCIENCTILEHLNFVYSVNIIIICSKYSDYLYVMMVLAAETCCMFENIKEL